MARADWNEQHNEIVGLIGAGKSGAQNADSAMVNPEGHSGLRLPRWIYVPGVDTEADHVTLARAKALVPARFEGSVPASHPALRYGLALNDAGFFWECHEILETVWAAAPQGGRDRILLRACIQVAHANLKHKQQRQGAVVRLIGEALAELDQLGVGKADNWGGFAGGFAAEALASQLRRRLEDTSASAVAVVFKYLPKR